MAISNSLNRVGQAMAHVSFPEALARGEAQPGVAALAAAHEVDGLAHAELVPLDALVEPYPQRGSDDLRLPPPPGVFTPRAVMSRALGEAVATFEASAGRGVNVDAEALAAEAKMIALVRGIQGLQRQIEARRDAQVAA